MGNVLYVVGIIRANKIYLVLLKLEKIQYC